MTTRRKKKATTKRKAPARKKTARKASSRRRSPLSTAEKREKFLVAYRETGNVTLSAQAAGVARSTHYKRWTKGKAYRADFEDARSEAADVLEREARRRAVSGTKEPVFYGGEICGHIRRYSDTLLIFLLKAARPEKYRERSNFNLNVADEPPKDEGLTITIVDKRQNGKAKDMYSRRPGPPATTEELADV